VESNSDFDREYDLLKEQLDRAEELKKSYQGVNSNLSTINVNMNGSHGVWLCVTCCLLTLLACFFIARDVDQIKQNDRDQGNQLNAIYMLAPHLRQEKKP
jgi:hypothetical protein